MPEQPVLGDKQLGAAVVSYLLKDTPQCLQVKLMSYHGTRPDHFLDIDFNGDYRIFSRIRLRPVAVAGHQFHLQALTISST